MANLFSALTTPTYIMRSRTPGRVPRTVRDPFCKHLDKLDKEHRLKACKLSKLSKLITSNYLRQRLLEDTTRYSVASRHRLMATSPPRFVGEAARPKKVSRARDSVIAVSAGHSAVAGLGIQGHQHNQRHTDFGTTQSDSQR